MHESMAEALDSPVRQEETANGAALLAGFARRLAPLAAPGPGAEAESPLHTATSSQPGASLLTGGEAFSDARGASLTPGPAGQPARPLWSPAQRPGLAPSPVAGGSVSPRWPAGLETGPTLRLSAETLRRRERAAAAAAAAAGVRSPIAGSHLAAVGSHSPVVNSHPTPTAEGGQRAAQPSPRETARAERAAPARHSPQPVLGRGAQPDMVPREQLLQADARTR